MRDSSRSMKEMKKRSLVDKLRFKDSFYPVVSVMGFVLIWYGIIFFLSVPKFLLPDPYAIFHAMISEPSLLFSHLLVTVKETVLGFILALVVAVPISVAVVWWKPFERTVMPLMVFMQTVPKVSIAPLFIIWFGFGYIPKVLVSFLLAYFPIVIEMITGMRDVPFEMLDLSKSMSASPIQTFIKFRIPNSLPYLFNGLKLGILLSLTGAITGEFMGSTQGLGYLIMYANVRFNTTLLFAVLVCLLLLGKLMYSLVEWIERHAISWHVVLREKERTQVAT
jgi:NitT/TauT family transport system permease protein